MASNYLKMNKEKTQAIWLGMQEQLIRITEQILTQSNTTVQF